MASRRLQPYQQGRLDGLCGIYSLVNAPRLLYPKLDKNACEKVFRAMIKARTRQAASPLAVISYGLSKCDLLRLTPVWRRYLKRKFGIKLEITRLKVPEPTLGGL